MIVEQKHVDLFDLAKPPIVGDKQRGFRFHCSSNLDCVRDVNIVPRS
jgi:hypothetical protein